MKRFLKFNIIVFAGLLMLSCQHETEENIKKEIPTKENLDAKYYSYWKDYQIANTAKDVSYLTIEEKEIFYYLNLVRINPPLFAQTYAFGYNGDNGWSKGYAWEERKESLIDELLFMEPVSIIYPDDNLYEMAHCFAYEAGLLGITGHDRSQTSCNKGYNAECCQYGGAPNGLSIIMSLLIDAGENNAALLHRRILLENRSMVMGASIQPHKNYRTNAVLDFGISKTGAESEKP
ncbi:MAG: hypothetical protein LBK97_02675 [Prevotellaceae bacterium]|jgi:hypothetical protein|nr:hypothetical protein [Prevotellaceae bacterium]